MIKHIKIVSSTNDLSVVFELIELEDKIAHLKTNIFQEYTTKYIDLHYTE